MAPTVSVIVPTYNRADAIPRTIESVLSQTLEDLELIIVDDASQDDTEEVVTSYDDDRIQFVQHEENQGASAARNTGIERAEGEYMAFLDSDDVWLPTKLEKQVLTLELRSDEWVAAYCKAETVHPDGQNPLVKAVTQLISRRNKTEGAEGGKELIGPTLSDDLHTSAGSTLIVESDIVREIDGFDESFSRFQDPEFLIRVLKHGKLACVNETLLLRYETGSPPADSVAKADEHFRRTFSEEVERLEQQGIDVTGAHHYILARHYLDEGQFRTGFRYLRQSRRPEPRQLPGLLLNLYKGVKENIG
ncbi:glycosyltransferase family 2 protein [Haladaptatus sp. T7]|uniref:glycosyltransferase family 2 protein n=1 Tax=Haladaptatus sp. T7 TaxID=2029368 RepID=UPI0021A254FC|nr:glycosyltransferase family 2 protein [Haladaptatus sp. T7]GKZ16325.1 glycosyl transferase [Haladaptatus sp. T7]